MRTWTTLTFILTSFLLHGQSTIPSWGLERFKKFSGKYVVSNYIKPQFLQADFSGDKKEDLALLIERKADKKKGIIILFAQSDLAFIVGAGNKLSNAGDNFDCPDNWTIFKDEITYETTFKEDGDVDGGKEIKLNRHTIKIREEEGSGGLIYFDGRKFVWIHQGD